MPVGTEPSHEQATFSVGRVSTGSRIWSRGRASNGSRGGGLRIGVGVASLQAACLGSAPEDERGKGEGMATGATATTACHGHRRPTFGWGSLPEAELRVVGLAAEGLTNRQIGERLFVSRRTVATHLEHVFQKLGFSTRARLAAEAGRRLG